MAKITTFTNGIPKLFKSLQKVKNSKVLSGENLHLDKLKNIKLDKLKSWKKPKIKPAKTTKSAKVKKPSKLGKLGKYGLLGGLLGLDGSGSSTDLKNTGNVSGALGLAVPAQRKDAITDLSDALGKKKKYGPYDDIDELIKSDKENRDIMSRISNMIYTTNMYVGGYGKNDFKVLNKFSKNSMNTAISKAVQAPINNSVIIDKLNSLERKLNPVVPITEETGQKIVDSNTKIEGLLQRISDDMVDEQDTAIKQTNPEVKVTVENNNDTSNLEKRIEELENELENQGKGFGDAISNILSTVVGLGSMALLGSMMSDEKSSDGMDAGTIAAIGAGGIGAAYASKKLYDRSVRKHKQAELERLKEERDGVKERESVKEEKPSPKNEKEITKATEKEIKKGKFKVPKIPKGLKFGGPLALLSAGVDVANVEIAASEATTQDEKDKIRGEGYTTAAAEAAGGMAGAWAGASVGAAIGTMIFPGVGTAVGGLLGGIVGGLGGTEIASEIMDTKAGQFVKDIGTSAFKFSSDNDIMEELDDKGIIDYDYMGESEILNRDALKKLDPETIKKLIDYDDFSSEDLSYLKELYAEMTGKKDYDEKDIQDQFDAINDARKAIDDKIDTILRNMPESDADLVKKAYNSLKRQSPDLILDPNNRDMKTLERYSPVLAKNLRDIALSEENNITKATNTLGKSRDDILKKYHIGTYSQSYLSSETNVRKYEEETERKANKEEVKSSDVTLDHITEYDNTENAMLDEITKQYEMELPQTARYTGNIKLAQGKGLSATGSKCMGAFVNHKARGIRNNNPGNIRISTCTWLGKVPLDNNTDGTFEQFVYPEYGIRALALNLKNYQAIHNLYSIRGMITRFAPSVENNTNAYVTVVSRALGISPDEAIDFTNPEVSLKLVKAIIIHENGENPYTDEIITRAINSALGLQNLEVDETAGVTKMTYDDTSYANVDNAPSNDVINSQTLKDIDVKSGTVNVDPSVVNSLDNYVKKNSSRVDLDHLQPEFKATLASAAKAYYDKFHEKLPIETAFRNSKYQGELFLRKAMGDKGIRTCAMPCNDESYLIGSTLGNGQKVDPSLIKNWNGITVSGNNVIVKGSGGINAHGNGMAVDIPAVNAGKFEVISRRFGLGRPDVSGDNVHFQMFRDGKWLGGGYSNRSADRTSVVDDKNTVKNQENTLNSTNENVAENVSTPDVQSPETVKVQPKEVLKPKEKSQDIINNYNSALVNSQQNQGEPVKFKDLFEPTKLRERLDGALFKGDTKLYKFSETLNNTAEQLFTSV